MHYAQTTCWDKHAEAAACLVNAWQGGMLLCVITDTIFLNEDEDVSWGLFKSLKSISVMGILLSLFSDFHTEKKNILNLHVELPAQYFIKPTIQHFLL